MDPKDLDDFMRRVVAHLKRLDERVSGLEVDSAETLAVPAYDDIQVSIAQLIRPASQAPTWRNWNFGIGGGVQFQVLGFGVNNQVDLYIQTSHAMRLESILNYHMHWSVPSNATTRFRIQIDAIYADVSGAFAVVPGSPFTVERVLTSVESGRHNVLGLAAFDSVNQGVSTAFIARLTRIAASVSEYAGEVYIFFSDGHFQGDALGSRQEFIK